MSGTKRQPVNIGEKYGRLTIIELVGKTAHGSKQYHCLCDCGNETIVLGTELRRGHTKSCGCLFKEVQLKTMTKHGKRYTRIYEIWVGMKQRCENPNKKAYEHYGGRNICICKEWHSFEAFYDWAMANGYKEGLSIDRINNNGNYEPANCRWVTVKEQQNNRRNSHFIEAFGERHTIAEWAEITGLNYGTLKSRLKRGWAVERALQPLKAGE